MRTILSFLCFAFLLVACNKDLHTIKNNMPPGQPTVLYASIANQNDSTRTFIDTNLKTVWHNDDRISVFFKNSVKQEFRFIGEDGSNYGLFRRVKADDSGAEKFDKVYALYPHSAKATLSEAWLASNNAFNGTISFTWPSTQVYAEKSFGKEANVMMSIGEDDHLVFKNLGGYLVLKLYGTNQTISSIELTGNNSEILAGLFRTPGANQMQSNDDISNLTLSNANSTNEESAKTLTLKCDAPVTIGKTASSYTEFWFVLPPVTFSKGFTIKVYREDGWTFEKTTTKPLTISRNKISRMQPIKITATKPIYMPEMITIPGISIKWGSFNLGAIMPAEYGDYYAWGETETKNKYTWSTYKYCNGTSSTMTKYNDTRSSLEPEDDVVRKVLKGKWRMPKANEIFALCNRLNWRWEDDYTGYGTAGIVGYLNENNTRNDYIFFPASGYKTTSTNSLGEKAGLWVSDRYYNVLTLSSSDYFEVKSPEKAVNFYFTKDMEGFSRYRIYDINIKRVEDRRLGLAIRPVWDPNL